MRRRSSWPTRCPVTASTSRPVDDQADGQQPGSAAEGPDFGPFLAMPAEQVEAAFRQESFHRRGAQPPRKARRP